MKNKMRLLIILILSLVMLNVAFGLEIVEDNYYCTGDIDNCDNAFDDDYITGAKAFSGWTEIHINYSNPTKQALYPTFLVKQIYHESCIIDYPTSPPSFIDLGCNGLSYNSFFWQEGFFPGLYFSNEILPVECYNKTDVELTFLINGGACFIKVNESYAESLEMNYFIKDFSMYTNQISFNESWDNMSGEEEEILKVNFYEDADGDNYPNPYSSTSAFIP